MPPVAAGVETSPFCDGFTAPCGRLHAARKRVFLRVENVQLYRAQSAATSRDMLWLTEPTPSPLAPLPS